MWRVIALVLACGSLGALAEAGVMGRLSWCNTMCMCETETNREVKCFQEDEIYSLLNVSSRIARRLRRLNWTLEENVYWCDDLCTCNLETGKEFECAEPGRLTQLILDNIGNGYFLEPEGNSAIKREEERSVDEEEEEAALDQEAGHKKRSERKKNRKNRKLKKNQKVKHRHPTEEPEPEPEPEWEPEPEPEWEPQPESEPEPEPENTYPVVQTPTPPSDTPAAHVEPTESEAEIIEPLPKQEAVAASPAVTALQPPTRQGQFYTTAESYTPRASAREVEGLSPRIQPVVEVPKEKKTVASMVSQDLDDLGSTVRNIKNDVMLNQRILLVTVAIAGLAMLGVMILAILSCTKRRQNQNSAAAKKRDGAKDGNHSPKINLEEAW